ncbi:RagB/SusD family nutrient uptake outer membrane protein [Chitinophaga skermanii]|nr:RagB/SusD family nutrient uptake outer membrane protein [Chitinophaga skermanii]
MIEIDPPSNSIGNERAFADNTKAYAALSGVYSLMVNNGLSIMNGGATYIGGLLSDELKNLNAQVDVEAYAYYTSQYHQNSILADGPIWNTGYKIIYTANSVIEGAAASTSTLFTDSARAQINGECKFVRALMHFYLTNFYGPIPVVTTSNINEIQYLERSTPGKVYQQIESDLQEAINQLPANYNVSGGERIRANKYVAKALLARVYLYQKKFQQAKELAEELINTNLFPLDPDLKNTFEPGSKETIFGLKLNYLTASGNVLMDQELIGNTFDYDPTLDFLYKDPTFFEGFTSFVRPKNIFTPTIINTFEVGDLRRVNWCDTFPVPDDAPYNGVGDLFLKKYRGVEANTFYPQPQTLVIFRSAELYLIAAEAKAELGDATAANDLNVVRKRAGLENTTASGKEALLNAIMHERQVEFMGEQGHRWFDLKRRGLASSVLSKLTYKQPWVDYRLLLPIPKEDLQANPALGQNKGY